MFKERGSFLLFQTRWEASVTVRLLKWNVVPPTVPTSLQEHARKIKGPEPQEAVFRARATERWGNADGIDGNARTWVTQTKRHTLYIVLAPHSPMSCFKLLTLCHTDSNCTWFKSLILPVVCRQQSPDIFYNNSAVINLKDIAASTADVSVGKQSRGKCW